MTHFRWIKYGFQTLTGLLMTTLSVQGQTSWSLGNSEVRVVEHASFSLFWQEKSVLVDPVGDPSLYPHNPHLILITDVHGDHFQTETLSGVVGVNTSILAPKAVFDQMPPDLQSITKTISNGQSTQMFGLEISAIPMYNLRQEALSFHPKGRGNGYILTMDGKRWYISGDTEDIPEMRQLRNIDVALLCMNLPYTMTVESASSAIKEFKPRHVLPYHYRGKPQWEDPKKIEGLVQDPQIQIILLDWYPKNQPIE